MKNKNFSSHALARLLPPAICLLGIGCSQQNEPAAAPEPQTATSGAPVQQPPATQHSTDQQTLDAIVRHFKTKEKSAKDAAWTSPGVLKIGVLDNGKDRSGYAEYSCNMAYELGYQGTDLWVQIFDVAKALYQSKFVKLGEYTCQKPSGEVEFIEFK